MNTRLKQFQLLSAVLIKIFFFLLIEIYRFANNWSCHSGWNFNSSNNYEGKLLMFLCFRVKFMSHLLSFIASYTYISMLKRCQKFKNSTEYNFGTSSCKFSKLYLFDPLESMSDATTSSCSTKVWLRLRFHILLPAQTSGVLTKINRKFCEKINCQIHFSFWSRKIGLSVVSRWKFVVILDFRKYLTQVTVKFCCRIFIFIFFSAIGNNNHSH